MPFQLFVRCVCSAIHTVETNSYDTIGELKRKIQMHCPTHVPWVSQRLIHGGRQLNDDRTLSDCGITAEYTVHISLRLCGRVIVSTDSNVCCDEYLNREWGVGEPENTIANMKRDIIAIIGKNNLFEQFGLYRGTKELTDDSKLLADLFKPNELLITLMLKHRQSGQCYVPYQRAQIERKHAAELEAAKAAKSAKAAKDAEAAEAAKIAKIAAPGRDKENDLKLFLQKLDLSQYCENFIDNAFMSVNDLKEIQNDLDETHLERMGINKIFHQMKLLKSIRSL